MSSGNITPSEEERISSCSSKSVESVEAGVLGRRVMREVIIVVVGVLAVLENQMLMQGNE